MTVSHEVEYEIYSNLLGFDQALIHDIQTCMLLYMYASIRIHMYLYIYIYTNTNVYIVEDEIHSTMSTHLPIG
jgi:hypothetical protein